MAPKNIVLVHGWGAESGKLMPLGNELNKLGWQILPLKLVGFEKPAPKDVWGIKEYSDYVLEEVLNKFGEEKFFIFGHSFGGGIAIKLASGSYKNLGGVILCATRGISRGESIKRFLFNSLAKTGKVLLITPQLADKFRKLLYKAAREHDYEKTQGIMKEVFKKVISEDLKPLVAKIKIPTLVLWGEEDRLTSVKDAHFIKSALPDCKLVIYKGEGHRLPYEKPVQLAHEIDKWYQQI
jgi:pimeloyl-ACP methyl ester carboxylesterase